MTLLHDAAGSLRWITVHESESTRFLELDGCEEGAMDLFTEDPVFNYLWFHRASVLAGEVRRALVLGAGAFTAAKCLALDHPAAEIHAVDVEAQLEPIARTFFRLDRPEFARVIFHGTTAEAYLATRPGPFDFVFDDLFDGFQHVPRVSRVPEHFAMLRAALRPGGLCVKNLIWDAHSASTRAACDETIAAARARFHCHALPSPPHRGHSRMLFATDAIDWSTLVPRLIAAGIPQSVLAGCEFSHGWNTDRKRIKTEDRNHESHEWQKKNATGSHRILLDSIRVIRVIRGSKPTRIEEVHSSPIRVRSVAMATSSGSALGSRRCGRARPGCLLCFRDSPRGSWPSRSAPLPAWSRPTP